jgi:hypothetical protein
LVPDAALVDVPASLRGHAEPTRGAAGSGGNGSGPGVTTATKSEHFASLPRTEPSSALGVVPTRHEAGRLADTVLEELARDSLLARGQTMSGATGLPTLWFAGTTDTQPGQVESQPAVLGFGPVSGDDLRAPVPADQPAGFTARLAAILLAVGYWRHGARIGTSRKRGAGNPASKRSVVQGQKRDLAPFQA